MDETDNALISALRRNARASYSDLAAELGLARATVRSRVERLEKSGVILGYSAVLQGDVQTTAIRGLMMISIEGRGTSRIIRQLEGLREVQAVHSTNGRWDLIVELGTDTLEHFDQALSQIRRFDGVVSSETNLLLSTHHRASH